MDEVLHKPAGRRPRQSDGRELSAQEQLGLLARRVVTDWKHFYQWARFHGRRVIHTVHDLAGGNRATGPVTFLAVSGALGLALTVSTLYAPAYTVTSSTVVTDSRGICSFTLSTSPIISRLISMPGFSAFRSLTDMSLA